MTPTGNHSLLLCIGSNTNASDNISRAETCLHALLGHSIRFSPVLQTPPIGIDGPCFLNQMAEACCSLPYPVLNDELKKMERLCGNSSLKRKQGIVELDIDILWYDGKRYHEKDWNRPYVKTLLELLDSVSRGER